MNTLFNMNTRLLSLPADLTVAKVYFATIQRQGSQNRCRKILISL